jgi:metal-responsive CopG/Arc/MetJ family transcriptional regulator
MSATAEPTVQNRQRISATLRSSLEEAVDAYIAKRGIKRSEAYGHALRARPDITQRSRNNGTSSCAKPGRRTHK